MQDTFNGGYLKALLDVKSYFERHSSSLKACRLYNSDGVLKVLSALINHREEMRITGDCFLTFNPKTKQFLKSDSELSEDCTVFSSYLPTLPPCPICHSEIDIVPCDLGYVWKHKADNNCPLICSKPYRTAVVAAEMWCKVAEVLLSFSGSLRLQPSGYWLSAGEGEYCCSVCKANAGTMSPCCPNCGAILGRGLSNEQ